MFKKQILR